jgi:hypothetical protein
VKRQVTFLLVALVLLASCGSAPTPIAQTYRTIGSLDLAVQTALKGWWTYEATGKATQAQEDQVKAAFQSYQSAAGVAADVLKLGAADIPPTDLADAASKLLGLLQTFGVYKPPVATTTGGGGR